MSVLAFKNPSDGTWIEISTLKGDDGQSAYDLAVQGGYQGTEEEFIALLGGLGDGMKASVYDPQGKETDVFAYINEAISDGYIKTEVLSDDTKTAFGLVSSAVPDDVLSLLSKAVLAQQGTSQGLEQGETGSTGVSVSQNAEMTAGNGVILIGSASTTSVHGSKDGGKTFQEFDRNHGNTSSLAFGNGSFVRLKSSSTTEAYISTDGQSWSTVTLPVSASWSLVRYLNGYFYAFASSDEIAYSQDGQTWDLCAGSFTTGTLVAGAAYLATAPTYKYVYIRSDGEVHYSSNGGVSWYYNSNSSNLESISTSNWTDIAAGAGVYVAVNSTGTVATSTDGKTWTQINANIPANRIIYEDGLFVAVGNNGVWCSEDGQAWIPALWQNSNINLTDVCYLGDGTFYAINSTGTTYYTFNTVTLFDRFTNVLGQPTGICHIETGSYIGTGLYGPSNPNRIAVSGTPVFVVIWESSFNFGGLPSTTTTFFGDSYLISPVANSVSFKVSSSSSSQNVYLSFSNGIISLYAATGSADLQYNTSGTTYNYLVFCI